MVEYSFVLLIVVCSGNLLNHLNVVKIIQFESACVCVNQISEQNNRHYFEIRMTATQIRKKINCESIKMK